MIESQNNFDMGEIESAISKAGSAYHKLLLLVGKSGAGKTPLLRHISQKMEIPLINLGLLLSRAIVELDCAAKKAQGL